MFPPRRVEIAAGASNRIGSLEKALLSAVNRATIAVFLYGALLCKRPRFCAVGSTGYAKPHLKITFCQGALTLKNDFPRPGCTAPQRTLTPPPQKRTRGAVPTPLDALVRSVLPCFSASNRSRTNDLCYSTQFGTTMRAVVVLPRLTSRATATTTLLAKQSAESEIYFLLRLALCVFRQLSLHDVGACAFIVHFRSQRTSDLSLPIQIAPSLKNRVC